MVHNRNSNTCIRPLPRPLPKKGRQHTTHFLETQETPLRTDRTLAYSETRLENSKEKSTGSCNPPWQPQPPLGLRCSSEALSVISAVKGNSLKGHHGLSIETFPVGRFSRFEYCDVAIAVVASGAVPADSDSSEAPAASPC